MPNRRERREAKFGKAVTVQQPSPMVPPVPIPSKPMEGKDIALWCVAIVIALGFPLLPIQNQISVCIVLALMAVFAIQPVLHLPWVYRASTRTARTIHGAVAIVLMLGVVATYGYVVWPPVHRHTLSDAERNAFEKPLLSLKEPKMSVHLYCAPGDEIDCEYAASLIPLFGQAGWDVSGTVDRFTLTRPEAGILIGMHGTVKPEDEAKLKWNQGEWTKWTPEVALVRQAFVNIGIEPDSNSGYMIPENQINIYVSHERENESAPTDMTRNAAIFERETRDHHSK